jgi:hypothetical protein
MSPLPITERGRMGRPFFLEAKMATISANPTLTIGFDESTKIAKPVVKYRVNFTSLERHLMENGLKFMLKCELWGRDPPDGVDGDDLLYTFTPAKHFPGADETGTFTIKLGEAVLDEDAGADQIYGRLTLKNEFTKTEVKRSTNQRNPLFQGGSPS